MLYKLIDVLICPLLFVAACVASVIAFFRTKQDGYPVGRKAPEPEQR